MLSWLAPIIVFGLVVFVHELGHFLAAKFFGVYAPRFSIGFGPSLFKWRRGETEYKVGILPLGGYVRMASRLDEESAFLEGGSEEKAAAAGPKKDYDPNAMIPFGPKPIPENRWFESKPLYARLVIMLAGVFMNLVLGWFINVGIAATYGHNLSTKVKEVLADRPAAQAGFQAGDSIVAVNGTPILAWESLLTTVDKSTGQPLTVDILRNGQPQTLTVTPALDTLIDEITGDTITMGKIGLIAGTDPSRLSFGEAIRQGNERTIDMATLVFTALKKLATREVAMSELGGPIAIAQASYESAKYGLQPLLSLLALISINLAVFNLLPIPILDGGQIVVQIIESIRGRPLTDRAREYVARVGLAFILLLFVTVMFNDIKRLLSGVIG
jgi:regulator of sigma E protease